MDGAMPALMLFLHSPELCGTWAIDPWSFPSIAPTLWPTLSHNKVFVKTPESHQSYKGKEGPE